jgi:tRNA-Thr(GGU) m(6)t(6)A37 methyltransferase TsaA
MKEQYGSGRGAAQPVTFYAIGMVENEINELVAPDLIRATKSRIVLDTAYVDALLGLEAGQEILVIFHFHRSVGFELQQHPRRDHNRPLRGVFALRSPQRPNPIGVTKATLVTIDGNVLTVNNLDAVNGTPVLDIKPA